MVGRSEVVDRVKVEPRRGVTVRSRRLLGVGEKFGQSFGASLVVEEKADVCLGGLAALGVVSHHHGLVNYRYFLGLRLLVSTLTAFVAEGLTPSPQAIPVVPTVLFPSRKILTEAL